MSGLGLYVEEEQQLLQQEDPPQQEVSPGFFAGVMGAPFAGLASGAVKAAAPAAAGTVTQDFNPMLGALGGEMFPTEDSAPNPAAEALTPEQFDRQRREALAQTLAAFKPDAGTTGFAGQLLFGITDLGSRYVAGTALAGPFGGAALAGGTEGYAVTAEQEAAGVDPETARQVGVIQGGAAAIGGLLPVGFGASTVAKVSSGVALNVGVGAVSRGTTAGVLAANGYEKQAEQFKWLDAQALIADAVLGAGFGYAASPHAAALSQRLFADGAKPAPEQIAAAAVAQQHRHAEVETAPGITVDSASRDAHTDNLVRATEALLNDEPVPALRDVSVVDNPEQVAFRQEAERVMAQPLDRRADSELRARIDDMPPEQRAAEIAWLREENQRLNNELRTDPLTGLGNKRAWAEIEADPALPVKAMLDVDSLKWVNDTLGHEAGDSYLVQVGEAIKRAGAENAVRLGGDEFAFAARTPEAADALAARINEELAGVRVEATTPDGEVITKTGAGVSYGRGANRSEADAGLYRNKQERTVQGLRGERGAEPGGVSRQPAARQQGEVPPAPAQDGGARIGEPPDDGQPINQSARAAEDLGFAAADESASVVLAEQPDLMLVLDDGTEVRADAALAEADAELAQAQQDADLYNVAVSCFLRNGV